MARMASVCPRKPRFRGKTSGGYRAKIWNRGGVNRTLHTTCCRRKEFQPSGDLWSDHCHTRLDCDYPRRRFEHNRAISPGSQISSERKYGTRICRVVLGQSTVVKWFDGIGKRCSCLSHSCELGSGAHLCCLSSDSRSSSTANHSRPPASSRPNLSASTSKSFGPASSTSARSGLRRKSESGIRVESLGDCNLVISGRNQAL